MQQVSDKKQQIEDAEKQSKINELYELSKKVDELSTSLPQVVERLVSLKELHEQGNYFFFSRNRFILEKLSFLRKIFICAITKIC